MCWHAMLAGVEDCLFRVNSAMEQQNLLEMAYGFDAAWTCINELVAFLEQAASRSAKPTTVTLPQQNQGNVERGCFTLISCTYYSI